MQTYMQRDRDTHIHTCRQTTEYRKYGEMGNRKGKRGNGKKKIEKPRKWKTKT
jgi:hypothetical protein